MIESNESNGITRRQWIAGAAAAGLALAATARSAGAAEGDSTLAPSSTHSDSVADSLDGWATAAPRDEIRPRFDTAPTGGPDGRPCLVIQSDAREGLDGCWKKIFPVTGGKHSGIRYQTRFSTGAAPNAVALFDTAGQQGWPTDPHPVDGVQACTDAGIRVARRPTRRQVRIVQPPE